MDPGESRLWKWAVAVGALGILLMLAAVLMSGRRKELFGVAVFLGLVCVWTALLMLVAAWIREMWRCIRLKAYGTLFWWLALALFMLLPFCRRAFF